MVDVLTLHLDSVSQQLFNSLRERYFPPERNHIPAHLTLFHALPDAAWAQARIEAVTCSRQHFSLDVTGLRSLGKGVAYRLASSHLQTLHAELAEGFADHLIPQDRQRLQPHVVVQNKVAPEIARQLLAELQRTFAPWSVMAEGLDLWHYLGGPWQHVRTFRFLGEAPSSPLCLARLP